MIKSLAPVEIASIQKTLVYAREGRATLTQLAAAHDLAEGSNLNGALGELRKHICQKVSPLPLHDSAKHIALGVISGILAHHILH